MLRFIMHLFFEKFKIKKSLDRLLSIISESSLSERQVSSNFQFNLMKKPKLAFILISLML